MKILHYFCRTIDDSGWEFSPVEFQNLNLLVGDSATGKTRLLNTIFNLGLFVTHKRFIDANAIWEIVFEHADIVYTWHLAIENMKGDGNLGIIKFDNLWKHDGEELIPIIQRDEKTFKFIDDELPKLSPRETSISLLKEEEIIKPLYKAFSMIKRRVFSHAALSEISEMRTIPSRLSNDLEKRKNLDTLFREDLNLSANLFILQKYFKSTYKAIIAEYKKIFPFVKEARITELAEFNTNIAITADVPVFSIKERGSDKWIPVDQLSSGMQKVLLILTDIFLIPDGGVYIIDEYENSLGISAIDFFPEFILTLEKNIQFIITSHHPYIINAIPYKNWYLFHRDGMRVSIKYGEELVKRFGTSRQEAFVQLINDPFFTDGVVVE